MGRLMALRLRRAKGQRQAWDSRLLSASEDCRHYAWVAVAVHNRYNPQWLFVRRIGNQILVNRNEAQRARGQIRTSMALTRKWHESANAIKQVLSNTPSGLRAIACDISPNFRDVFGREGMKVESLRHGYGFFNKSSSRWRRLSKNASPSTGFTLPLFRSS